MAKLAQLYSKEIVRLHGVPSSIVLCLELYLKSALSCNIAKCKRVENVTG